MNKKKIENWVRSFYNQIHELQPSDHDSLAFIYTEEKKYGVRKKDYKILKNILMELYNEYGLYDINNVYGKLLSIIRKCYQLQDIKLLITESNKLFDDIKNNIHNYIVICPINNLALNGKIQIGNVTFYNLTNYRVNKICKSQKNLKHLEPFISGFKKKYENTCCSEISLTCEENVVNIFSYNNLKSAINILRFFTTPVEIENYNYFGTYGEYPKSIEDESLIINNDNNNITFSSSKQGFLFPFYVDETRKIIMNKENFKDINKILMKNNNTPIERSIISSIIWYGEAMNISIFNKYYCIDNNLNIDLNLLDNSIINHKLGDAFIKIFIALESLFVKKNESNISKNISERITYLVGSTVQHRITSQELIEKYYDMRSDIVHNGRNIVHINDFEVLSSIAKLSILKVIRILKTRKIHDHDDLFNYINKIKYQ